nr:E3 ubiquitin-protein ligase RNF25 isoform X1 [Ipomoea trifida]
MSEEEVLAELEAVEAVYGDDCIIFDKCPPNFHLRIKPRTADITSQQFVEAIISIQACPKYPDEPPCISIVDSKGLDEQRQKSLTSWISEKAQELSSCLMLVSLCEEAVERLSSMNHPDGNCPLCLYPLVDEDTGNSSLPFMKLMSCFHCFHCDCIIRWWNWLQDPKETDGANVLGSSGSPSNAEVKQEESKGNCPVCRKVFLARDIEHARHLVGMQSHSNSNGVEANKEDMILQSELEKIRKQKFDAILKIQQEKGGLIEAKQHEVLRPGVYLQRSTEPATGVDEKETSDQQHENLTGNSQIGSSEAPATSTNRNFSRRKPRGNTQRKQVRQWIKKEDTSQS